MKTLNLKPIIFALIISLPFTAYAQTKRLGFYQKITDAFSLSAPKEISLQRVYHSRSLYNGLLGYGWCLDFDKSLEFSQHHTIIFKSCQVDQAIHFKLETAQGNTFIYKNTSFPEYQIHQKDQYFYLFYKNQNWIFNQKGQLIYGNIESKHWSFEYNDKNLLVAIILQNKYRIRIHQNLNTHLIENMAWKNFSIHLKYQDYTLIEVASPLLKWSYQYDSSQNLIQMTSSKGNFQKIGYDLKLDQISYLELNGYQLHFDSEGHLLSIKDPKHQTIQFEYNSQGKLLTLRSWKNNKISVTQWDKYILASPPNEKWKWTQYLTAAQQAEEFLKKL
ncbi:MAG: hypothetical protein KDD34_01835 [Bdellovibrionales bacterium]|nr:hypothetical protein [Bdellovibrionales bacterium]